MALESTIESYLVKRVEALGGICLKGDVPGRRFLDRVCILPGGRTVYVECKKPKGGRKRAQQIYYVDELARLGHEAYFCKTKQEVDNAIDRS